MDSSGCSFAVSIAKFDQKPPLVCGKPYTAPDTRNWGDSNTSGDGWCQKW